MIALIRKIMIEDMVMRYVDRCLPVCLVGVPVITVMVARFGRCDMSISAPMSAARQSLWRGNGPGGVNNHTGRDDERQAKNYGP